MDTQKHQLKLLINKLEVHIMELKEYEEGYCGRKKYIFHRHASGVDVTEQVLSIIFGQEVKIDNSEDK